MTSSSCEIPFNLSEISLKTILPIQNESEDSLALRILISIKAFFSDSEKNKAYNLSFEDKQLISRISTIEFSSDVELCKKIASFIQRNVIIVSKKIMEDSARQKHKKVTNLQYFFGTARLENFSEKDVMILEKNKKFHWINLQQAEVALISEQAFECIQKLAEQYRTFDNVPLSNDSEDEIEAIVKTEVQPLLSQPKTTCCSCAIL